MKNIKVFLLVCLCLCDLSSFGQCSIYNFDMDRYLSVSKDTNNKHVGNRSLLSKDGAVNLPRAFNENAAFRVRCNNLHDCSLYYDRENNIHTESHFMNETEKDQSIKYEVEVFDVTHHNRAENNSKLGEVKDVTAKYVHHMYLLNKMDAILALLRLNC